MVKFILTKSPDEWATTKQACRDELVVYLFFSPIYIYIYIYIYVVQWLAHLTCNPGDAGSIPTHGIKCFLIRKGSVSSSLSLFVHSSLYIYLLFCLLKEFTGNTDENSIVLHDLIPPISARYIRFRPTAWHQHISMRVELYGCCGTIS